MTFFCLAHATERVFNVEEEEATTKTEFSWSVVSMSKQTLHGLTSWGEIDRSNSVSYIPSYATRSFLVSRQVGPAACRRVISNKSPRQGNVASIQALRNGQQALAWAEENRRRDVIFQKPGFWTIQSSTFVVKLSFDLHQYCAHRNLPLECIATNSHEIKQNISRCFFLMLLL